MQNFSTIIVAKNEEDSIGNTIQSVKNICSDIVVVDTGSTDQTVQIAVQYGVKVIIAQWYGYGKTKNLAVKQAIHQWVLSLDADEILNEQLCKSIESLDLNNAHTIYYMNRLGHYNGQEIHNSGWSPDWIGRLYHRDYCKWTESLVHEKLSSPSNFKKVKLEGRLLHYSYKSDIQFRRKSFKYAYLSALEWHNKKYHPSFWKRYFGAWWKYIHIYLFLKGYKDGSAGKEIAKISSEAVRLKIWFFDNLSKFR